ncbi:helicase-related protein [Salegentibacter salarius]|uniref:Helicase n=1 Tax=Salegentibacter salarius TaxID=435906 RepID=A0A2N0TX25_9FLAO|nr:helicase-related protein [Salegentibacter salarius]OEY72811.1 helicase [Salegentibacter salarius]PKD19271.1 helicase [Salegentibacter salarius]SLJ99892.1 PLD-like domain-containing protein [Salegentibacter salarius]
MSTKFFTNRDDNTLLKKFQGVFEHNPDINNFDALVGYFRASGYFRIRPFLENVPQIRILVGINVDKILATYQSKGLLFHGDANQTLHEFLAAAKKDIQTSKYSKEVEQGILQFIEDICTDKIEVKAHPSKKLHAKIYIFRPEIWNEHRPGDVITGSSNLTDAGLGGNTDQFNYEFNVILRDYEDVKFASEEFEKLWEEGVSILPVEIQKIKKETYLNDNFTPFEVYMKFLIEYFGKSVEFDPNSITDLPEGFKRLSYQIDAVTEGFKLLEKHNGFFLSDVVGLGKTVVGTLIAKKFFYSNDFPSHISNILIIVPPALKENWRETLEQFNLHNYKIITNGSIHKLRNPDKYDLVIVDEAHKFRNDTAEAYNELQKLCKTDTRRILKGGGKAKKKVILISATPLNNRPSDIANQVYLFQDSKDSSLEVSNLQHFFRIRIDAYNKLKDNPNIAEVQHGVKEIYADIREKIIKPLTVRRTRTDLRIHEQYAKDLEEQGIKFPDIEKPKKILYKLDPFLESLYDETMALVGNEQTGIKYYRYQAIKFLIGPKKEKYKNADTASFALAKLMKTLLVKRIDSSFHAFKISLQRFTDATRMMIKMFENNRIYIAPNVNVNEFLMEEREDELIDKLTNMQMTDPSIEICSIDDFADEFYEGLKKDFELLEPLNEKWQAVDQDPKMDEFLHQIQNGLLDKKINPQSKLVVFSESQDTTKKIIKELKKTGRNDVLEISSSNRDKLKDVIRENFDANIPRANYKDDYNIIIATEVLAEGVNLHRSNVILNYDTPWNSTKLMQRIGRVNRIGSVAPKVHIFNFYPTANVNNDIELEKKAIMKLQAFHSALGEDSEIYSPDEETQTFGLFEKDMDEEKDEKLAYLMELRKFKKESPEMFRKIKNMPVRARVARKSQTNRDTTICFMRNRRRDAFYQVNKDLSFEELTFVETAKQFNAVVSEKALQLPQFHHEQVGTAVKDFNEKVEEEMMNGQVVDTTQGPNEKRALAYLDGFLHFEFLSDIEKDKIKAAKTAIKLGKFQKLQREINKLKKNNKKAKLKAVDLVDALLRIIDQYPILSSDGEEENMPAVSIRKMEKLKPELIISESFIFNE